jgi:hypothetical protein
LTTQFIAASDYPSLKIMGHLDAYVLYMGWITKEIRAMLAEDLIHSNEKACPLYMRYQLWIGKKVVCLGKMSDTCLDELNLYIKNGNFYF